MTHPLIQWTNGWHSVQCTKQSSTIKYPNEQTQQFDSKMNILHPSNLMVPTQTKQPVSHNCFAFGIYCVFLWFPNIVIYMFWGTIKYKHTCQTSSVWQSNTIIHLVKHNDFVDLNFIFLHTESCFMTFNLVIHHFPSCMRFFFQLQICYCLPWECIVLVPRFLPVWYQGYTSTNFSYAHHLDKLRASHGYLKVCTRWFKVTFLSLIWRSLSLWKGHLYTR